MIQNIRTGVLACWFLIAVASVGRAAVPAPSPGEVQHLTVISLALQAGSTEKETRQVTYTPPPGWYVRGHHVDCTKKIGNSSYSVTTVPRDWSWSSEEKVRESYKTLIDLAGKSGNTGLKAKFSMEREQALSELRKVRSTHHALIVDATAKGEGFLRGAGGLELTVTAELVFVGTDASLDKTVAQHKASLSKPETPEATRPMSQGARTLRTKPRPKGGVEQLK